MRSLGKWTHLSVYQEKLSENRVRCTLCPHNCEIIDGNRGICRTRINLNGELFTTSYGNPCSIGIDPIEKKPLFHFYPGKKIFSLATAGCNFRCLNCQNWQISQEAPGNLDHYDLSPNAIILQTLRHQTPMIAFTYTEPTVYFEYMLDIARLAKERGLKVVMISNGFINRVPLLDLCRYLDAANIDLKCFDEQLYRRLTGGKLKSILDTLLLLKENGVWLEITNLVVPTYSDDLDKIEKMCHWLMANGFAETPLHFSKFAPGYKLSDLPPTPESTLLQAKDIAESEGMKFVYIGNHPHLNCENTICPNCKRLVVERNRYEVTKNFIYDGICEFCGGLIPGRWQ